VEKDIRAGTPFDEAEPLPLMEKSDLPTTLRLGHIVYFDVGSRKEFGSGIRPPSDD
jgi:hypothetical protein